MNRPPYVTDERLYHFIDEAIKEDSGDGDHSTLASVPVGLKQRARLYSGWCRSCSGHISLL